MSEKIDDLDGHPGVDLDGQNINIGPDIPKAEEKIETYDLQSVKSPQQMTSFCTNCFNCLLEYFTQPRYRPFKTYFDITTSEIIHRLVLSVFPYFKNFNEVVKDKPDLYLYFLKQLWTRMDIYNTGILITNIIKDMQLY